ncbi:MAG: SDR family NAD(P)-dependent oxidoreductase [Bacteroidales bacterium]|nr:SDR family NAD(P)-dependent oxidoreductase [Bacteroidales bacterium]
MVALITGGSSGMGLEFARQLAGRGYDLLLVSNKEDDLAKAYEELVHEYKVQIQTRFQDLSEPRAADDLFAWCQGKDILPDVLVNNAGMFFFKELEASDLDRIQAMVNLHVTTVTRLCILFSQAMKERGSGRILIVSSMAAKLPTPGITIYSATKAYLRSFGKSLSFETKPYGVSVTTVCPAAIATPLYNLKDKWLRLGVRVRLIHTPQWLVRRALKAMFKGRRLINPSIMNVYLPVLIASLPGPLEARIWEKLK